MYVKPKKKLGQHFLTDNSIAERIVNSLPDQEPLTVLEVGPGTGVLTRFLILKENFDLSVIEIDYQSVDYLNENFPELKERIFTESILNFNFDFFRDKSIAVIGNFPYNISSQIVFKVIENRQHVHLLVGMFQKEVAQRIASKPSSKVYGIISVLAQAFFDIEYLFTVDENVFNPPPKVKSGVIRMTLRNKAINCNEKLFFSVVKTTFNQRRKTIRNSMKPLTGTAIIESDLLSKRPEQLSVAEFIELTNIIESKLSCL